LGGFSLATSPSNGNQKGANDMRKISLLLATLLAAGCVRTSTNPATGKVDVDVESPTKKGEDWGARLNNTPAFPGAAGEVKVTVVSSQTDASITVTGLSRGGTYPWHIHANHCSNSGGIIGDASAYPPLSVGADGVAKGNAHLSVGLQESKEYSVNVHASPSDMATIVACGDLVD
jgi:hypothetical protein